MTVKSVPSPEHKLIPSNQRLLIFIPPPSTQSFVFSFFFHRVFRPNDNWLTFCAASFFNEALKTPQVRMPVSKVLVVSRPPTLGCFVPEKARWLRCPLTVVTFSVSSADERRRCSSYNVKSRASLRDTGTFWRHGCRPSAAGSGTASRFYFFFYMYFVVFVKRCQMFNSDSYHDEIWRPDKHYTIHLGIFIYGAFSCISEDCKD